MLLCLSGLSGPGSLALAQTDEAEANPVEVEPTPEEPLAVDQVYRRGPDGQWRRVPAETALKSISQSLEIDGDADPLVSDYFISKLQIAGEAAEQWANLTAQLEVHVVRDDRWLEIPLRLDQALLLEYSHAGDGEAAPSAAGDRDQGLVWLLRGKGVHTLTFVLRVPLRQTTNGSQLQLRLPELAELFAGEFQLRIPGNQLSIQTSETIRVTQTPQSDGTGTLVRAAVTGDRIDLRWHPVVEETSSISRALTNLVVRLRDDTVQLAARQEIRLRQTGVAFVDVRVPTEPMRASGPVRISEASGAEQQVVPVTADREGWVRVPLDGVVGTVARLDWSFEAPFDETTKQIAIDGLELASADEQTGTISIEGFDRHRLTRRGDSGEGVTRIGVDELPAAGAFANLAYRFQTGSYRLVLDVDPIESSYGITPVYVLELTGGRARLETRFLLSVDAGQVDALSVIWPQTGSAIWSVAPVALGGGEVRRDEAVEAPPPAEAPQAAATDQPAPEVSDVEPRDAEPADPAARKPTRWLLKPTSPWGDGDEPGLTAECALAPAEGQATLSLTLPRAADARILPGQLIVVMADHVQATLTPRAGTVLTQQSSLRPLGSLGVDDLGDRAGQAFEIRRDNPESELTVDIALSLQDRQIQTHSVVTVDDLRSSPLVTQVIRYEVEFGRLSSVRLSLPDLLHQTVSELFRAEELPIRLNGDVLPAAWDGAEADVPLPTPRLGRFDITIGPYRLPRPATSDGSRVIPIVSSVDHSFSTVRVEVPEIDTVAVTLVSESWTALGTVPQGAAWITNSSPASVTLNLATGLDDVPQRAAISTAFLQSQVYEGGAVLTVAQYRLATDVPRLVVRLPSNAESPTFAWGAEELTDPAVRELPDIAGQYVIERPAGAAWDSWLSIRYRVQSPPLRWVQSTPIRFPSFGAHVQVDQTYWQVSLPRSLHLLSVPPLLSPQYEWARQGLVWRRSALPLFERTRAELIDAGATPVPSLEAGNNYEFQTLGKVPEVHVASMSSSLLVFLGAGITLIASFLVIKVPAGRSLWLWLLVGAALAVLALLQLETLLLLMQPAAYGMVLPLLALVFEKITERKSVLPESLSTRASYEIVSLGGQDSSHASASDYAPSVPSTLVRPTALSDSGVR